MIKNLGPIRYFWGKKKCFLSTWLVGCEDRGFGWEWGIDEYEKKPLITIQFFGLTILYFEKTGNCLYVTILGFWLQYEL